MISELLKQHETEIRTKINSETAKIGWQDLQRYFAGGNTLFVSSDLDLVDVAYAFHEDEVDRVASWTESGQLVPVSDGQARDWHQRSSLLWAVVVKPWVLVQTIAEN